MYVDWTLDPGHTAYSHSLHDTFQSNASAGKLAYTMLTYSFNLFNSVFHEPWEDARTHALKLDNSSGSRHADSSSEQNARSSSPSRSSTAAPEASNGGTVMRALQTDLVPRRQAHAAQPAERFRCLAAPGNASAHVPLFADPTSAEHSDLEVWFGILSRNSESRA